MKRLIMTTLAASVLAASNLQTFDSSSSSTSEFSSSSESSISSESSTSSLSFGDIAQGDVQAQSSNNVVIQNFAFAPGTITVAKGTTVTWSNKDSAAHTVTVDSGNGPQSGELQNGQSYSYKFDQAGKFSYHCKLHQQMKAAVTVTEAASPAPAQKAPPSAAPTTPPPTSPTPSAGVRGEVPNVAAGPVAAGGGSTAGLQHGGMLAGGTILLALAGSIMFARRRLHLER
jgi:plastocyanin